MPFFRFLEFSNFAKRRTQAFKKILLLGYMLTSALHTGKLSQRVYVSKIFAPRKSNNKYLLKEEELDKMETARKELGDRLSIGTIIPISYIYGYFDILYYYYLQKRNGK